MTLTLDRVNVEVDSRALLHDVSCELRDGEITLLIGRTGSGKSTLLRTLAGLVAPASGRLAIGKRADGGDTKIGYAMQYPEHQLFAGSVEAEFAYSLRQAGWSRREIGERTREACEAAGLSQAMLELSPYVLSGGEKRRVALAALFAVGNDWLLLDEPTAALDGPGVRWLTGELQARRGVAPGGLVVATHDLDAMLPLADRVLVLQGGRIAADLAPAELCRKPEVLLQSRVGLPASMRLAAALARAGVAVAAWPLAAGDMAAAVAAAAQARARGEAPAFEPGAIAPSTCPLNAPSGDISTPKSDASASPLEGANLSPVPTTEGLYLKGEPLKRGTDSASEGSPAGGFAALVRQLDPRAKWLCYILLSAGVLLLHSAIGLAAATLVTAAVVALTRTPWPRLARFAKPYAWFISISVIVAGIRFGYPQSVWPAGLSFSPVSAWITFSQLYKIALIMALGVTLSETVPHAEFRRALDYVFTRLSVLRRYAQPLSLAAELLLKFIPIIIGEVSRLTMAVKARRPFRQRGVRKPIRPRELPALTVPLLLSVMQRADDLSTAMEHRGFSSNAADAASQTNLHFRRTDYVAIVIGVIWLIGCIFLA